MSNETEVLSAHYRDALITAEAYRSAVTAAGGHSHHGDHTPMTPQEHVANLVAQWEAKLAEAEARAVKWERLHDRRTQQLNQQSYRISQLERRLEQA